MTCLISASNVKHFHICCVVSMLNCSSQSHGSSPNTHGPEPCGVRPYRPQTISVTTRRYRPQQKNISATRKINIGYNHIGQNHIGHKRYRPQNIRRVYLASSCRYRTQKHILNLNVKTCIVTVRDCQSFFGVDLPSIVLAKRFDKFVDRYGNTYI